MIQLQSTQTVRAQGVKALVYGPSGTGKTRLAATAPSPVIASAESGLLSLRSFNLPFVVVNDIPTLAEFHCWCVQSHEARQFQTIVIDSVSEIAEVLLKSELGKTKDPRKAYGELIVQMISLVRDFRDMPGRNLIVTAKQEAQKDEASGAMMFGPSMPGSKVGPQLPYYFDEVFQTVVTINPADGKRNELLRTQPDYQNVAKDRSGALQPFEPQHFGFIVNKIMGS